MKLILKAKDYKVSLIMRFNVTFRFLGYLGFQSVRFYIFVRWKNNV